MIDWDVVIAKAKASAGEWILAGGDVSAYNTDTVRKRRNRALREVDPPLEARMPARVGKPPRGDLYVRYLGERVDLPPLLVFRPIEVSVGLKGRVRKRARALGEPMTNQVERALERIARRGILKGEDPEEMTTINVSLSSLLWDRAKERAAREGFSLTEAIRRDLTYEANGRS